MPQVIKGYLADPKDKVYPSFAPRRAAFTSRAVKAEGDYDIPEAISVFDQGQIGACVVNSWVGALEILLGLEGDKTVPLSRLFLYWLCRAQTKTQDQDSGTYPYLAGDRMMNVGLCSEDAWPYLPDNLFKAPPLEAYNEASDNKTVAMYRIDSDGTQLLDDIETAVRANHPVVFGTEVDDAIQTYKSGQVLGPPTGTIDGGHAMVFTGVRFVEGERLFRVRNSFGADYGDNGHILVNEDWVALTSDLWVPTRIDPVLL